MVLSKVEVFSSFLCVRDPDVMVRQTDRQRDREMDEETDKWRHSYYDSLDIVTSNYLTVVNGNDGITGVDIGCEVSSRIRCDKCADLLLEHGRRGDVPRGNPQLICFHQRDAVHSAVYLPSCGVRPSVCHTPELYLNERSSYWS